LLWGLFLVVLTATVFAQAELAWLFVVAGLVTLIVNAPPAWLKRKVPYLGIMPWPFLTIGSLGHVLPTVTGPSVDTLVSLLLFFVKAGAFVFGSGLAIVPFLYEGVVKQYHWLNEPQFRDAVAIAMITPGPVVITVAFIGYVVAGFAGAVVAAVGIFLPVYVLTIGPARWFRNNRDNVQLKAFVQGATAAATGAISGAVVVIGARTLVDVPTVLIAIASLAVLLRFKVQEPLLVTAAGLAGLVVFPLLHGGG